MVRFGRVPRWKGFGERVMVNELPYFSLTLPLDDASKILSAYALEIAKRIAF